MKQLKKSSKTLQPKWELEALGTGWSIETPSNLEETTKRLISQRIEAFDRAYSRFRDDSLVAALRHPGIYEFPPDITAILKFYECLYELTDGRVTPLIGSMLEQAGYDALYSFVPRTIEPTPPFSALGWDGNRTLTVIEPIVLDIGAAGKGYLVDSISEILEERGVRQYVIDASGDIKQKGPAERVGLEHPFDTTRVIGVANVVDASICASAVNRRRWGEFHHVFDPISRRPVDDIVATWAVSNDAMVADGLATALFFVPPEVLATNFQYQYVVVRRDGTIDYSQDFDGELFI
jgi:FAD:protein FMN transferase